MCKSARSGYTLIELMVVLSVSSTLLMVAVGWIHQSMTLASVMRDRQHHHQSLMRLSRQLRDDVHRSVNASMASETQLVITLADDRKLSYTISGNAIWRRSVAGDQPVLQDKFEFYRPVIARWDASELPDWISLVVAREHDVSMPLQEPETDGQVTEGPKFDSPESTALPEKPRPVDLHVRAAIGRWGSIGGVAR